MALKARRSRSLACLEEQDQAPLLEQSVDVKGGQDQVPVDQVKVYRSAFLLGQMLLVGPNQVSRVDREDLVVGHRNKALGQRTVACVGHMAGRSAVDSQDLEARDRLSKDDLAQAHLHWEVDEDRDGVQRRMKGVLLERWW